MVKLAVADMLRKNPPNLPTFLNNRTVRSRTNYWRKNLAEKEKVTVMTYQGGNRAACLSRGSYFITDNVYNNCCTK